MQPFIDANTRVFDLAGKTVVPGFIDAHAHPAPEYSAPDAVRNIQVEMTVIGGKIIFERNQ